jgi:hypothetical protein
MVQALGLGVEHKAARDGVKVMADVVAVAGRSSMSGDENVSLETYSHVDNGTASAKQT